MEHGVDLTVAGQIESVVGGFLSALTRRGGDGSSAAPAGELAFAAESGRVADLHEEVHGAHGTDADLIRQGGPETGEESGDRLVDGTYATVEAGDVLGRVGQPPQVHLIGGRDLDAGRGTTGERS